MTVISMMMEIKQRNIIWDFSSEQQESYFSSRKRRRKNIQESKRRNSSFSSPSSLLSHRVISNSSFSDFKKFRHRHQGRDLFIRRQTFKEMAATFVVQKASSLKFFHWNESPNLQRLIFFPDLPLSLPLFLRLPFVLLVKSAGEGEKQQEKSTWSSLPAASFWANPNMSLAPRHLLYITLSSS